MSLIFIHVIRATIMYYRISIYIMQHITCCTVSVYIYIINPFRPLQNPPLLQKPAGPKSIVFCILLETEPIRVAMQTLKVVEPILLEKGPLIFKPARRS